MALPRHSTAQIIRSALVGLPLFHHSMTCSGTSRTVQTIVILFCAIVMISGDMNLVKTTWNQISFALHLPMPYVYASIIVGGILMIFYALIFI